MNDNQKLRSFILLTLGQTASQLGTSLTGFGVSVWVYRQSGSVMAASLLNMCSLLPALLAGLFGGGVADREEKKRVLLLCDLVAAAGSACLLLAHRANALTLPLLCAVNAVNGLMNAFQQPASQVAATLLIPEKHYVRAGGAQTALASLTGIFSPMLAAALLAAGGLDAVIAVDLITFGFAFGTLLLFVRIPEAPAASEASLWQDVRAGAGYLRHARPLLALIAIYSGLNFFAALSFDGMMSPLVLARSGNDAVALGWVSAAVSASSMAGGLLVSVLRPAKRPLRAMFAGIWAAFAGIGCFGLARGLTGWIPAVLVGCFGMPFYFAYETAIIRRIVPVALQGRVFALKETLVKALTLLGFWLGALLADHVFEPLMHGDSRLTDIAAPLVGRGDGAGMGLLFFLCGATGILLTAVAMRHPAIRELRDQLREAPPES